MSTYTYKGFSMIAEGSSLEDVSMVSVRSPHDNVFIALVSTHRDEDWLDYFIAGAMNAYGKNLNEDDVDDFTALTTVSPEDFHEIILTLIMLSWGEDPSEYNLTERPSFGTPWTF